MSGLILSLTRSRQLSCSLLLFAGACGVEDDPPERPPVDSMAATGGVSGTANPGSSGPGGTPTPAAPGATGMGSGGAPSAPDDEAPLPDAGSGPSPLDAGMVDEPELMDAATAMPSDDLIGWASVAGDGIPTTTGGAAGRTVQANGAQELIDYALSDEALVIELQGTYAVPRLQVSSNKTLIGVAGGATIEGGVRIRGSSDEHVVNVIVKNVRIYGATSDVDGDGMHIYYAHHVWVDHCEVWDSPDGNLDVVHAANWVTVSWTRFRYTNAAPDPAHRFSNLIGHTDGNDEDIGRLKVTWHHNHWSDGVIERMPRVRYGDVHVFNNYYSAAGNNYTIGAAFESRLLIEDNHFEGVADPHLFYDGEPTAEIAIDGNLYTATSGAQDMGQGSSFTPPYPYTPDPAAQVKALVGANAGPQ